MHRRRLVCGVACGALIVAPIASAAQSRKVYRVGILGNLASTAEMSGESTRNPAVVALLAGLRSLGYVYGVHFVTEARGGEGKPERFPELAAEVVRLQVDVIVTGGGMLYALKATSSTIPVVMVGIADPVAEGFARTLARPGGNYTGFSTHGVAVAIKRLELLKELVPKTARIAVLWHQTGLPGWQGVQAAARARGWELMSLEVRQVDDIEEAFRTAVAAGAGALLVFGSALLDAQARRIVDLAAENRLPAMHSFRSSVEAGGLISYGVDITANYRRAAIVVDKILKGAKPGDIPIEEPTTFELAINLTTAKKLGLVVPQSILLRADAVLQ